MILFLKQRTYDIYLLLQTLSKNRFRGLLGLVLLTITNLAFATYTFPGGLPSGCSGSAGAYTCGNLNFNQTVILNDTGKITITVNGNFDIGTYTIGSSGKAANVLFIVNGVTNINASTLHGSIYSGANNISVGSAPYINGVLETTSGSIMNVRGTIEGGLVTTSGTINIEDNTVINGPISGGSGKITIRGNVTTKSINCNCEVDKDTSNASTANGDITVSITNSSGFERFTINGNLRGFGDIELDDDSEVTGCMQSLSGRIDIDSTASVGKVCCGGDTSCSKSCSNTSSPPLCTYTSTPYLNYRMDEASWNGTANEVVDSSVNALHGSATKKTSSTFPTTATSSPAISGGTGTCGYGVFDGGQYINIPSGFSNLTNSLTITAWIKTTNNTVVQRIFADDENNKGGYGLSLGDGGAGKLRFYKRSPNAYGTFQNSAIETSNVIANNQWYFVAVTVNAVGQAAKLFVYNPSNNSTSTASTTLNYFSLSDSGSASLGSENINSSETAGFIGNIDELNTYNRALTDAEVTTARQQTHACPTSGTLIAQYAMEEATWNGTSNETKDTAGYTGGPFDGQGSSTSSPKPTATSSAPAKSGTIGTCGYASFTGSTTGGSAFTLDNLPVSTSAGVKTSVSFWVYWDGATNGRIAIGWGEYVFGFLGSWVGFNTNYNDDIYGASSTGLANGWHHVVAVFNNGNVTSNKIYIDGVLISLAQRYGSANNAKAYVQSTMMVGGRTFDNLYRFTGGRIDEVKVYNGEMTQVQVTADYNATHACTGMPNLLANYHFEESTWTGATGEILDASGNNYHAKVDKSTSTARALPEDATTNRFVSGSTGTCGYGIFGVSGTDSPIVLPSNFPNLTGSFTYASWYLELSTSSTARRIFADDYNTSGGFIFSANDGGAGKLRFAKRATVNGYTTYTSIDTPAVITTGTKYFIAVSVNAVDQTATIYVYNTSGTLLNQTTGAMGYFGGGDNGNISIGSSQSSSGNSDKFHGRIDEVSIYNSALTQPQILTLLQTNHACVGTNVAATNFNCVVTGGSADTGRLYTQLSNTTFNVDVVALKADRTVETAFVTSGTKNVTLDWISNANSTCSTGTVLTPSTTVTFSATDSGRKAVSISAFNKAYRDLRCRVTDANQSPSVVGCSSDNFAVRPANFTISSSNANADNAGTNASATTKIKTGANFALTATAVTGYDGTPTIDNTIALSPHAGAVRAGSLTGVFSVANAGTGSASSSAFTYNEVGYFRLAANTVTDTSFTSVDQPNDCQAGFSAGTLNACNIGNTLTNYFGRFYPDHFAVGAKASTATCNSSTPFTYFGQDGLANTFSLVAQNSSNITTENYSGDYAKLALTSWLNYGFSASNLGSATISASATAPTGSWSNGVATVNAKHLISRPNAPVAPASIVISAAPVDSDGVTMVSTAVSDSSLFRYGRLNMPNAYGSELLPLVVPVQAQYWNGVTYLLNTADNNCTVIPASSIAMSHYKSNLAPCETQLTGTGAMSLGKTTAKLSKPGVGNNGSVDLTLKLISVSTSDKTCNSSTESNATAAGLSWFGTTNPNARATFGLFKSPVIYMRENY